jgi:hypothetical protein
MKFHYKIVKHSTKFYLVYLEGTLFPRILMGLCAVGPSMIIPRILTNTTFQKISSKLLRNTTNVKGDDMKRQRGWPMGDSLCIFPCDVKRQIKNQYDEKSLIGRSDSNFIHQSVRQMSIGPFVGPSVKQVGIGSFIGPSVKQVRITPFIDPSGNPSVIGPKC